MEFSSFEDFWTPHESREGPVAEYVSTLPAGTKDKLRRAVKLAYVDGSERIGHYAALREWWHNSAARFTSPQFKAGCSTRILSIWDAPIS